MNSVPNHPTNYQLPLTGVIREGRMIVDAALAARILEEAKFDGQRKSAPHHVSLLAHLMTEGRWSAGSQLAFCLFNGSLYLTNGKHRMNAVLMSGRPQEFQILITRCASMSEVIADYYRHDTASRARSDVEIISSTEIARESGLPRGLLKTLFSSAYILENGMRDRHYIADPLVRDTDAKIGAASMWMAEAREFARIVEPANNVLRQKLFSAGPAMVALMTIRHQPKSAEMFWGGLAADDGLRRNDPRKVLALDLFARSTSKISTRIRCMPSAVAWNAFYESRPLTIIKVLESSVLRIAGTPITGRDK